MTEEPLRFPDAAAFEAWMEEHHATSDGIAIAFAKKGSGHASIVYDEALEIALCFGWIDGQVRAIDAAWYRQRFTPRRPRSTWSQRNVGKVEALIAAGRMRPAGLAEVERARADGRWERAYAGPAAIGVPEDLQALLDADARAAAFWDGLGSGGRYSFLHRLHHAKRPQTRERLLERVRERRPFERP